EATCSRAGLAGNQEPVSHGSISWLFFGPLLIAARRRSAVAATGLVDLDIALGGNIGVFLARLTVGVVQIIDVGLWLLGGLVRPFRCLRIGNRSSFFGLTDTRGIGLFTSAGFGVRCLGRCCTVLATFDRREQHLCDVENLNLFACFTGRLLGGQAIGEHHAAERTTHGNLFGPR